MTYTPVLAPNPGGAEGGGAAWTPLIPALTANFASFAVTVDQHADALTVDNGDGLIHDPIYSWEALDDVHPGAPAGLSAIVQILHGFAITDDANAAADGMRVNYADSIDSITSAEVGNAGWRFLQGLYVGTGIKINGLSGHQYNLLGNPNFGRLHSVAVDTAGVEYDTPLVNGDAFYFHVYAYVGVTDD